MKRVDEKSKSVFTNIVTISELGRGNASKILTNLLSNNAPYFITKNSKPKAVMLTIDDYEELLEAKEELALLLVSQERIKKAKEEDYLPYKDLLDEFGINEEELKGVEVEFE